MNKKFYITTPIYYVNDIPHIGHTCTTVAADIIARYHKDVLKEDVFFLTGTDEHGAKVAEAAKENNLSPKEFCDKVSKNFQEIWPKLGIQYDYFIRTTDSRHEEIVKQLITKMYKKGDIYKDRYEGLYCLGCEKFVTDSDLVNGKCPLHPTKEIQKQSEDNYFFRLSKYAPLLINILNGKDNQHKYDVQPASKKEETLSKLKEIAETKRDLSISRANVKWGIPVPWDNSQTIYVWFDALINYYSALIINGKTGFWPADVHLIGKEILWFHAAIWEAMLISAEIDIPKVIYTHDFYMVDGQKMSKSIGNVISPQDLLNKFGVDGTRYLVAATFPNNSDSDISWTRLTEKYNADLANGLGNLVQRVAKLCETKNHIIKHKPADKTFPNYNKLMENFEFSVVLEEIWKGIKKADGMLSEQKPWKESDEEATGILEKTINIILGTAFALKPFIPGTADKIEKIFCAGKIAKPEVSLFPRIQ